MARVKETGLYSDTCRERCIPAEAEAAVVVVAAEEEDWAVALWSKEQKEHLSSN